MGVFFAVVPDLLDYLRASFAPGNESPYDETFDRVRNIDLLVLDDLGAQKASDWAQEKLYQVVNYRHVAGLRRWLPPTNRWTSSSWRTPGLSPHRRPARRDIRDHPRPHYRLGRQPDVPRPRSGYGRARR